MRSSSKPAKPTTATPMVKTLNPLIVAPPISQGSLPNASGKGRGAAWKTMVVAAVRASRMPSEATSMISGDLAREIMCM